MASIINKLLGRDDDSESHSSSHKTEVKTSAHGSSKGDNVTETHAVQHEGVNIKSTISSDAKSTVSMVNQQKLNDLVTKLGMSLDVILFFFILFFSPKGSTHNQIDEYAKKQTAKINDEVQREIDQVVSRTRHEQDELLRRANDRTGQIDAEYRAQLQKMVEEVDAAKARRIAEIEKELNDQQTSILQVARAEIDQLNQKAANMKIGVLQQAQVKAAADATQITAQAAGLAQTTTAHHSSGTTTIKTEVSAATTTKETDVVGTRMGGATTATGQRDAHFSAGGAKTGHSSETKTVETSHHQSHDSRK